MLRTLHRVKKKKDFEMIFKHGESFKNSFLILKVASNKLSDNRFGFVVSQKVSKKAVVRNKIRRRLTEIVKKNREYMKKSNDFVFIALAGIENEDFKNLETMTTTLLKKAKMLHKP